MQKASGPDFCRRLDGYKRLNQLAAHIRDNAEHRHQAELKNFAPPALKAVIA
jgi:hypothetical protein